MTLIASFEYQHVPIIVGDLLLSALGPQDREVPTPLVHTPNEIIGAGAERFVSGLRQKAVLLHEHICLAWTGRLIHAEKFAQYIRSYSSGKSLIDYAELRRVVEAYPRDDVDGHLQFIMYSWHGTGWGYFSNLSPFDLDLPFLNQIRVGGSGTEHFIRTIQHIASVPLVGNIDAYNEMAMRALAFAGLSSAQQVFGGIGLREWWGGGFEVVVFREGRLAKLGPICWLYWLCTEITAAHFSLHLKPAFMYQYYVDELTFFWIDEDSQGTNKLHSISPPFFAPDQPLTRPKAFDTDIVINLCRVKMLNGDVFDGTNVDTRAVSDGRDLIITWAEADVRTSVAIKEQFLVRMLRPMPLPAGATIDVDIWGLKLQFRAGLPPVPNS